METWLTTHVQKTGQGRAAVELPVPKPLTKDEPRGQPKKRPKFIIGSSPECGLVIDEGGWQPEHLRFIWRWSKATWEVWNLSDSAVIIQNRVLEKQEHVTLLGWDMTIASEGVVLRFERAPAAPLFEGRPVVGEVPFTAEGLVIGSGQSRDGGRPRLELDAHMKEMIPDVQAEIEKRGEDFVLINRNGDSKQRTSVNGFQDLDEQVLALGDCIQIPNCPHYTFKFTGTGLLPKNAGGILTGRDLSVVVPDGRRILESVSLDVDQGSLLGIIGGSGQGKSTLLNALCGVAPPTEGEVTVDGRIIRGEKDVARAGIAYVPQDDIVHRDLTVDEALWYAARLRLPATSRQIARVIDKWLVMLELTEHRMKRISDLSGGQRKRVSIASELLACPEYLFLDEPTSGLDPQTEKKITEVLRKLAHSRRMGVVCTTHVLQKAQQFKRLGYISRGRLIFHGSPANAVRFFLSTEKSSGTGTGQESLASGPVHGSGPASASGTASGTASASAGAPMRVARFDSRSADDWLLANITLIYDRAQTLDDTVEKQDAEALRWEEQYRQSRFFIPPVTARADTESHPQEKTRKVGVLLSFLLLVSRQWKLLVSARLNYVFLLMQALVIGGLIGWVTEGVELRMFLALISVLWFGCSNAAQKIVDELPIFLRERISGLGVNVYVLSKLIFISTITLCQAAILMTVMIATALVFHPPDAKLSDLDRNNAAKEEMRRHLLPGSDDALTWTGRIQVWRKAFELERAIEGPPRDDLEPEYQAGSKRDAPVVVEAGVPPAWRGVLSWAALLFDLRTNLVRELAEEAERDHSRPGERPSIPMVLLHALGLRLAAIFLAAVVGVAMGLAVSALVNTATQAMMWVPLLMIPQILLGGMVVKLPDMAPVVRAFSSIMPSFAAERINMVSLIFGQATPRTTNQTKVPGFVQSAEEVVVFVNEATHKEDEERYDRISSFNDSWQSLAVAFDRVGQRKKETSGKALINDVARRDLISLYQMDGSVFVETDLAAKAAGTMGLWLAISYVLCVFSLKRKKAR